MSGHPYVTQVEDQAAQRSLNAAFGEITGLQAALKALQTAVAALQTPAVPAPSPSAPLPPSSGGTGLGTYGAGDLLAASTPTTLVGLPDAPVGNALLSKGVGITPAYGKVSLTEHVSGVLPERNGGTNQSTYTTGDLLHATNTTVLGRLADVATGNALISGGVGVVPAWGKVGLATHVSGDLPLSNLAQASAASVLLGRGSAGGAGDFQEITLGSGLSMASQVLSATGTATKLASRAHASATQSLSHNTNTAIIFGANDYDYGSIHSTSVNNTRFTVPTGGGGVWLVTAAMYFTDNTTGTYALSYRVNGGASYLICEFPLTVATEATMSGAAMVEMADGDYLELIAYQFTSGGHTVTIQATYTTAQVARVFA